MKIIDPYLKAFFEIALGNKTTSSEFDQIEAELAEWTNVLSCSPILRSVLLGPVASYQEKKNIIDAISFKMNTAHILRNLLILMSKRNRLSLLAELQKAFKKMRLELEGFFVGYISSTESVDQTTLSFLKEFFEGKLGKPIFFNVKQDASLLAGLRVTVDGVTYDSTLRTQFQRLRSDLCSKTVWD